MNYALISDLHSNIEDTKAVLAHITQKAPAATIVGLGDLFECKVSKRKAPKVRAAKIENAAIWEKEFRDLLTFPSVQGNQEERIMLVTGQHNLFHFPEHIVIEGAVLIHGHQWKWTKEWVPLVPKTNPPLVFFGHSHEAGLYRKNKRLAFSYGKPVLLKKKRYGINVGAVWGSREWVLYDSTARTVTFMKAT